jgi:hypothetical protein
LSAEEIVGLAYELQEDMSKEASDEGEDFDLNDLSVDEFIALAAHLEEDMQKEAMMGKAMMGKAMMPKKKKKASGVMAKLMKMKKSKGY